jgi:hypothetical protein
MYLVFPSFLSFLVVERPFLMHFQTKVQFYHRIAGFVNSMSHSPSRLQPLGIAKVQKDIPYSPLGNKGCQCPPWAGP